MKAVDSSSVVLSPADGGWDSKSVAGPIVGYDDNGYYMLYQGWDKGRGPRIFGLATSKDGLHWVKDKANPVMTPMDDWETQGFECGCLLEREEEFWLYYTGIKSKAKKCRIGLATSSNLRDWRRYSHNPILNVGEKDTWDETGVGFPAVVKKPQGWLMMYGAYGRRSMQLGLAYSKDGKTWGKYPYNPNFTQRSWTGDSNCYAWDAGIEVHQVLAIGDWYIMFYEGMGKTGNYNIGVAYSPDGEIWARSPNNPLSSLTDSTVTHDRSAVHPYLLRRDMKLYYTEILHASVNAVHRICVAQLDPSIINPLAQPSLTFPLLTRRYISKEGLKTNILPCQGFRSKTFSLISSSEVNALIEIDPGGFDEWYEYYQVNIRPEKLLVFRTDDGFCRLRVRIQPIQSAIVSAWVTLGH